jgi:hypothetical protein
LSKRRSRIKVLLSSNKLFFLSILQIFFLQSTDTEHSITFIGLEPAKACNQVQPQSSVDALDDDDMRSASQLSDFAAVLRFSPPAILPLEVVRQLSGAQPLVSVRSFASQIL